MKSNRFYKKTVPKNKSPKSNIFTISDDYKENVRSRSYLGKKGYTIPKDCLSKEDDEFLRKDLFVKPEIFGANFGGAPTEQAFPVFRESNNKLYIPRFYGISRYGLPDKSEIQEGDDIDVTFPKELRDYQEEIIATYMNYVQKPICNGSLLHGAGGILEVFCGAGKTVCCIKIISLIKKKTLILVHKEFLMNQWIERIGEFLPGATIGKIQAQTIDIKDKDIVIGMIQTLYDKEFPSGTFDGFGLTIIDEVHRIGSEQFSKTLFKTITPYMLGVSATVDRKDKLTKILYMYIGEKIYSKKREEEAPVCVRAIEYKTNNSEFNETDLDFRGNPKYSSMIVKLCEYGPRSDFIIRVLKDLIEEEPDKQIMVLCHNRSLLTYLFEAINHRKIASVGFYVGGMKQTNLQETESKNIVLATYAMAAEALDIKTLSTLVMVTPKTDITQSVGRILRVKHEKPIIVDIVDTHDMFQKQWIQRRRFYKNANYRIRQTDSTKYTNMSIDWDEDKTWKRVFEPKTLGNNLCIPKSEEDIEDEELVNKPIIGKCLIKIDGLDD
jgi:superfamily II DNA or RNA helicase